MISRASVGEQAVTGSAEKASIPFCTSNCTGVGAVRQLPPPVNLVGATRRRHPVALACAKMIQILIPVLGRPANAQKVADSVHAATATEHIIVFCATRRDEEEIEACKLTGSIVHLVDGGHGEYARKINSAIEADYAGAEWSFTGADDLAFHPNWDLAALAREGPVIGTNDLGNPTVKAGKHATHSLVHRSYTGHDRRAREAAPRGLPPQLLRHRVRRDGQVAWRVRLRLRLRRRAPPSLLAERRRRCDI